jgi:predicted dehydrogenase
MRIGILGYGYWGPNLARNFNALEGCRVVRVCDLREARLAAASAQNPGVETTTRPEAVIEARDVDAVVIATPIPTHHELARRALEANKHVLVEKPIAASSAEARGLCELAASRGLVLAVDHTFLYSPAVAKIKELVTRGDLGRAYYFDSTRINLGLFQRDQNVLWDLAVHDLSILFHVFPERPTTAQAVGVSHTNTKVENLAYLTLRYSSGFIAHITSSWVSPVKVRSILIGGSQRMIAYNDLDPVEKVKVYDSSFAPKTESDRHESLFEYRLGDIFVPRISSHEALSVLVADFARAVGKGMPPLSGGALGVEVVTVLEAAQRSISSGSMQVPIGEGG